MRRARFLAGWRDGVTKPVFYHCITRVVERRLAFGQVEKEKFRTLMRMMEKFSGCRVVSYCLMSNHIHLMLEVPPMPVDGIPDETLLERLAGIYDEATVEDVAGELVAARKLASGEDPGGAIETEPGQAAAEIHRRYTYRMHDLGEFMKTLLQRFTQWFNKLHDRTGTLWEDRFKSVIVEDGAAARTIAAYIDLNPVRAGIVADPADYRWSSYGEAIGGGERGDGKAARAGLVRALRAHEGTGADPGLWSGKVANDYRRLLMAGAVEKTEEAVQSDGTVAVRTLRVGIPEKPAADDGDIPLGKMLRCRVRYFTDGAVIGSRTFVNEAFASARDRFGPARRDGARKLRGPGSPAAGLLWSLRDLRKGVIS